MLFLCPSRGADLCCFRFQIAQSEHQGSFVFRECFSLAERDKLADVTL